MIIILLLCCALFLSPTTIFAMTEKNIMTNNGSNYAEASCKCCPDAASGCLQKAAQIALLSMIHSEIARRQYIFLLSQATLCGMTQSTITQSTMTRYNQESGQGIATCKCCPDATSRCLQKAKVTAPADTQDFQCDVCQGKFSTHFSLKRHKKIHSQDDLEKRKPHQCTTCERRFAEKSTLQRHIRTHTGEKPFICSFEQCGKAFADRINAVSHEATHARGTLQNIQAEDAEEIAQAQAELAAELAQAKAAQQRAKESKN